SSSSIHVNPDIPESHSLRGWYDSAGAETSFTSHQGVGGGAGGSGARSKDELLTIQEVKDKELGTKEKPDYFSCRVTITFGKTDKDMWYPACKSDGCSKKVTDYGDGWMCEKCSKKWDEPDYRCVFFCFCETFWGVGGLISG